MGEPKFVVRIEADTRRVVIGDRDELGRRELTAADGNWLVDPPTSRCAARCRFATTPRRRRRRSTLDGDDGLHVRFDEPQHGVAPGQAVVCYDGDRVLGGGVDRVSIAQSKYDS